MAKMNFDEEGLLDEPCLSCEKSYTEDIWFEWCCDEKECVYRAESEDKESCDNCKHNTDSWDSDACDGCCGANSKWSGESYPGEFEAMEHNGRLDALENEEQA